MAHYVAAKCRLCRREGEKLYLKGARCYTPKCPIDKQGAQPPGQHGKKMSRRLSSYGIQLREKQKVKRIYSVLERQFRRYYKEALKSPQNTGERILQLLESRLDNIVYRLGLTQSRSSARQLVTHGNVQVDGKKLDIPSYLVKPGQVISLSKRGSRMALIKEALEQKTTPPKWLSRKATVGRMERLPVRDEMSDSIKENLIIEFYSR